MLFLGDEVALGADGFAAENGHQPHSAVGGRQPRPVRAERCDHQAQCQVIADRRQLGAQPRVAADLASRLCRIGMHLEMRRQRVQGLGEFGLSTGRLGRHCKAARDELCRLLLCRCEPHQPQALRTVLNERDQAQGLRFTALLGVHRVVAEVLGGGP